MVLKTTCIGAYPKPDWLPVLDWFKVDQGMTDSGGEVTRQFSETMDKAGEGLAALLDRATVEAVNDQIACGIDVPTDGEQRRENYIHYQCRHLSGFDFSGLTKRVLRDGAYEASLPTIRGKIEPEGEHFLPDDWRVAQAVTGRPVKITVPGPITIKDTTANVFYKDDKELTFDLARALNHEIRALAESGCKYIQVDEPLFARQPDDALAYGIEALEMCFEGVGDDVVRAMHMCCGYPGHLDDHDYHKADRKSYFQIAKAIDESSIDQVSIEDAHRHNDLSLLEEFGNTTVIFGAIAIANSQLETVEEVVERLQQALKHIDGDRLIVAPDCGLGFLGRDLAMDKLKVMCEAAAAV